MLLGGGGGCDDADVPFVSNDLASGRTDTVQIQTIDACKTFLNALVCPSPSISTKTVWPRPLTQGHDWLIKYFVMLDKYMEIWVWFLLQADYGGKGKGELGERGRSIWLTHPRLTLTVLVTTIIYAQWEGMGDVGSARYELALLPPCPTIRVVRYSN